MEAFLFSWNEYFASLSTLHRDAHLRLPGKAKVFREQFLFQHVYFGARGRVWWWIVCTAHSAWEVTDKKKEFSQLEEMRMDGMAMACLTDCMEGMKIGIVCF